MSDYKDRLNVAKKEYISTDGDGEAGVRLIWTLKQVGHSYTNMDVENLRFLFPIMQKDAFFGKDWAYIIGHVTQLLILPTIGLEIMARHKAS